MYSPNFIIFGELIHQILLFSKNNKKRNESEARKWNSKLLSFPFKESL